MEYNLGKVLLTPKGNYNGSTAYEILNVVTYNGSSYVAKQPTTGNAPSDGQTNQYWQLLASGAAGGGSVSGISVDSQQYNPDVNGIVTLPDYPAVPVQDVTVGGTSVVSGGIAVIPAIPDTSGKENKMQIASASGTTLSAIANTYHNFTSEVNTLAITLPAVTDVTHITNIVFMLTTGTTPAITFAASGIGINVIAQDGFSIEASTTYEINAIFNGTMWVVAAMKISTTPINS